MGPHATGWWPGTVYGLLVLESGIASADTIFHLVAVTIVLHSSTDVVVVARAFDDQADTPAWHGVLRRTVSRRKAGPG